MKSFNYLMLGFYYFENREIVCKYYELYLKLWFLSWKKDSEYFI